jgi:SAM-dependent methyltransferase
VPRRAARVVADRPLPFADAVFDVVVANLALGPLDDEAPLRDVHRVLKPAGWLLAALVGRNSWDALFDLVLEACERAGLDDVARAVEHERERLPDEAAVATACAAADLVIVGNGPTGVEERLVGFASDGAALWADPLASALLTTWCEAAGLPAAPALAALREPLIDATTTFFPSGVPLVLHTSLWTARRED